MVAVSTGCGKTLVAAATRAAVLHAVNVTQPLSSVVSPAAISLNGNGLQLQDTDRDCDLVLHF